MSWDAWLDRYTAAGAKGVVLFGPDGTIWFKRGLDDLDPKSLMNFLGHAKGNRNLECKIGSKKFMFLRSNGSQLLFKSGPESVVVLQGPVPAPGNPRPWVLLLGDIKPEQLISGCVTNCGAANVTELPDGY